MELLDVTALVCLMVVFLTFGLHAVGELGNAAVLVDKKRRMDGEGEE